MKNYRKLVVADNDELTQKYRNEYRGKIQNHNVKVELEPMYALSYYKKESEVERPIAYHKVLEEINNVHVLSRRLYVTNQESSLNQVQVKEHFESIDRYTAFMVEHPNRADLSFARALDFYLVQDLISALDDLTQAILKDEELVVAYFARALVRCKQLEYKRAEDLAETAEHHTTHMADSKDKLSVNPIGYVHEYELIHADLNKVIQLAPDFEFAYYNRAVLFCQQNDYHAAMVDFGKAIELKPNFAEAYYNRGLTHIFLGQIKEGLEDLSKAGELGLFKAYNLIKRYSETEE